MFDELWNELDWEKREDAPRKEYWSNDFNRAYTYGRGRGIRTYEARPWHENMLSIRAQVEEKLNTSFEGCFVNGYTGEHDWLNWHADDDPGIDHSKPIVVVSLGQSRNLQTRKNDRTEVQTFFLDSGSMLVMPPGSQFTHQHRIPKVGHKVNPRISLTFRGLIA